MDLMQEQVDDFFLPNFCSPRAVLFLVVIAELFVLVLVLAWTGYGSFDWNRLALTSLFVQWIVLSSAAAICTLRPYIYKANTIIVTAICLIICLAITSVFTLAAVWVQESLSFAPSAAPEHFWQGQHGHLLRNNLIALIIGTIVLRYCFLQKELSRQQQAELTSRVQSLQSRIQPHFLFNSMNTIASLIATRPAVAEQVVEDLADLFRASLDKATVLIPAFEEIGLARQYLHIESLRFGERLHVEWNLGDIPESCTIPRLCLQPILENAITHGIQPSPEGGIMTIESNLHDNALNISVCNTLPNKNQSPETSEDTAAVDTAKADTAKTDTTKIDTTQTGNQIALENITDRLHALYGDSAYLQTSTFQRDNQDWYKTVIHCPANQ